MGRHGGHPSLKNDIDLGGLQSLAAVEAALGLVSPEDLPAFSLILAAQQTLGLGAAQHPVSVRLNPVSYRAAF